MPDVNVTGGGSSNVPAVDEKGVPYLNRVRELERKYQETLEELNALKSTPDEPDEPSVQPDLELQELVKNPREYTARVYQQIQTQEEVPQAIAWLESQEGYDKNEVLRVIRENNLEGIPSPKKQAKVAWDIIEKERLAKKFKAENGREDLIRNNSTESPGRSVPSGSPKVRRADLIAKLKEASLHGSPDEQARIVGMLEDVRE